MLGASLLKYFPVCPPNLPPPWKGDALLKSDCGALDILFVLFSEDVLGNCRKAADRPGERDGEFLLL